MIIVYGKESGCPRCDVIKKKLTARGVKFDYIIDPARVSVALEKANTWFTPIVNIDGKFYDFAKANEIINSIETES